MKPNLNLIVIRSENIEKAVHFYMQLGLAFEKHRHGSGPVHYAFVRKGFVFEIYPAGDEQPCAQAVRIGFEVEAVDRTVRKAVQAGGNVVAEASDSPWGYRAVIEDPDGRRVELVEGGPPREDETIQTKKEQVVPPC